jgi:hypothetical protein
LGGGRGLLELRKSRSGHGSGTAAAFSFHFPPPPPSPLHPLSHMQKIKNTKNKNKYIRGKKEPSLNCQSPAASERMD